MNIAISKEVKLMTIEERFTWHVEGDLLILENNLDDATEDECLACLGMIGTYANNLPEGLYRQKIFLVKVDKVTFTQNIIRAILLHAKSGAYFDLGIAYGAKYPLMLALVKILSTLLPRKPRLFRNRFEAIEYIKELFKET